MKHLRFSYVVLALCAGLLVYGLWYGTSRTSALFLEVREATGLVDADDAFPTTNTPTAVPTDAVETVAPQVTTTPGRTLTPERSRTPQRTASPEGTAEAEQTTAPRTAEPEETTSSVQTVEPVATSEPEQVVAPEIHSTAEPEAPAEPALDEPTVASSVPTTAAAVGASALPSATRVAEVAAAVATMPPSGQVSTGDCAGGTATLTFGNDPSYSGPGPFNAFLLVNNDGGGAARDVVLALTVIAGGEYFHEAVFGNGQLWWAHGAPDAGIIHVVPEIAAGGDSGVRFVATMRPEWSAGATMVIRVTVVGAECAAPSADEALLTFSATAGGNGAAETATAEPSRTPTPVRTTSATAVSTVLGIEENPTSAPRPTDTALPSGQILPDGGEGGGSDSSSAVLVLAGVAIALMFLGVGVVVGRVLPR